MFIKYIIINKIRGRKIIMIFIRGVGGVIAVKSLPFVWCCDGLSLVYFAYSAGIICIHQYRRITLLTAVMILMP